MAYQSTKTNWTSSDGVTNTDMNRVEGNTQYLKDTQDTHIGSGGNVHAGATQAAAGFMSSTDKAKLDGISAGAGVNQNTFASIATVDAAGTNKGTAIADTTTDTLTLKEGANIQLTVDPATDQITLAVAGTVVDSSKLGGQVASYYATKESVDPVSTVGTDPDANGTPRTVTFNRMDGTKQAVSTLSNPDANLNYQTVTVQYYDAAGTALLYTDTWQRVFNTFGVCTNSTITRA